MKKISLVIFCIWVVNVANAQQNQRRLSYSELFNEIQKQTNSTYYLENAEIYYSTADLSRMYYYEDTSTIKIDREIVFKNVLWQIGQLEEETYTFFKTHHIEFKKEVRFEIDSQVNIQRDEKIYSTFPIFHYCLFQALFINSQIIDDENHIKFDKCDINKIILRISNNSASNKQEEGLIKKSVEFHQSNINVVEIYGKAIDLILFDKCNIQRLNITEVKKAQINIHKCIFEAKEKQNSGITITKSTIEKIQIDSCTFEKIPEEWKKENPNLWSRAGIKDVNCEKLIITNSLFNSHFYIIGTKITEEIFLENNQFNNDFSLGSGSAKSGFERNIINFENAFMPFKQFKKGLSTEIGGKQTTVYYGNTPEQLADSVEYEHLLTYYNKFYKMYQDQKDRASANACFVLLKRLETRRLGYLASKDRTNFALLIEWQFNRFLDYTCEYGTNPFLALTISLKIMIIFALLLSVFPSEKDYLQPSEFRGALQRWGLALQKEG
ncbi:MAG: hypothetical protein NZ516_12115, partial [Raineya sp.]|nr:hypothetical protein [Raineya sp.]